MAPVGKYRQGPPWDARTGSSHKTDPPEGQHRGFRRSFGARHWRELRQIGEQGDPLGRFAAGPHES